MISDLDKIITKPVPQSYISVEKSVQSSEEGSIINEIDVLGEAKKRNKKILITDIAIQKVRKVPVPGFSEVQNLNLQNEHKRLLEYALRRNNSDEVMGITAMTFDGTLYGKGVGDLVGMTPQMESFRLHLPVNEGIIMHNHPRTKPFSFMDIGFFVSKPQIGIITIVSNQGDVHIMRKLDSFTYKQCIDYLKQLRIKHNDNFDAIVKDFLKNCRRVGIVYVRG